MTQFSQDVQRLMTLDNELSVMCGIVSEVERYKLREDHTLYYMRGKVTLLIQIDLYTKSRGRKLVLLYAIAFFRVGV